MEILSNEPMRLHTTFKLGGPADFFCTPHIEEEILSVVDLCIKYNIPLTVIGNGSNLIVRDVGVSGLVMKIAGNLDDCFVSGNRIRAQAGILIDDLIQISIENDLEGLECMTGVPAALGGAIFMNAGYLGSIGKLISWVRAVDYKTGQQFMLENKDLDFGYRTSVFHKQSMIILEAEILLKSGSGEKVAKTVEQYQLRRKREQPINYPSCGSVFKKANLKPYVGLSVGDAEVSKLCPAYIINKGNATAEDVLNLIDEINSRNGKPLTLEARVL